MNTIASTPAGIELDGISVILNGVSILSDVTARIERGSVTAIIGPNGGGKTTLLHVILGLVPCRGSIRFPAFGRRPRFGYVPQRIELDRGSPITVRDFLVSGFERRPLWLWRRLTESESAREALSQTGVAHLLERCLGRLSGGELQRVLLAQALLGDPEILLLDEPSSAVDAAGLELFCELLERTHQKRNLTTLLVSHDLSIVTTHAQYVLALNRTVLSCCTTPEALTAVNMERLFGPHSGIHYHTAHPPSDHRHE